MKFKGKYRRFFQEDMDVEIEAPDKVMAMRKIKELSETDTVKDLMFVSVRVIELDEVKEKEEAPKK